MTPMASGDALDLPFRIEAWDCTDSRVDELIALVGDFEWRWSRLMKQ
jgi:hypothetical protein